MIKTKIETAVENYSNALDSHELDFRARQRRVERQARANEKTAQNDIAKNLVKVGAGLGAIAAVAITMVASRAPATAERMQNSNMTQQEAEQAAQRRHVEEWKANATSKPYKIYIVKPGDNLDGIASRAVVVSKDYQPLEYSLEHDQGLSVEALQPGEPVILPADSQIGDTGEITQSSAYDK